MSTTHPQPAAIPPPRLEGRIRLPDGRHIGYAEYGDPTGDTILWFPGTPGGRRQVPPLARQAATELGVRLIALERPGIGDSAGHAYTDLRDWARDVQRIADSLGIGRFGIIALSGGGPYALACAHEMPERLIAACVLGGVAPVHGVDAPESGLVQRFRSYGGLLDILHVPLGLGASTFVYAIRPLRNQVFDLFMRISPEGDKRVFRRPEMREMFLDDLMTASRRGVRSVIYDARLFLRPWGFSVRDIRVPVRWWHGDADTFVPLAHAQHLAALIPDIELRIRPGETHLGTLDAVLEIFESLLALWPGRSTEATARRPRSTPPPVDP